MAKTFLKKARYSNNGDTLVEVLVSLAIVLILMVGVFSMHIYYERSNNKVIEHQYLGSVIEDIKSYYDKYGTKVYEKDDVIYYEEIDEANIVEDKIAFADFYFKDNYQYEDSKFYAHLNNEYKVVENNGKYKIIFWLDNDQICIKALRCKDNKDIIETICFGDSKHDYSCIDAYNYIAGLFDDYYTRLSSFEFYSYLSNYIKEHDTYLYLDDNYSLINKENDTNNCLYRLRYDNNDGCFVMHFYYRDSYDENYKYYKSINYGIKIDNLVYRDEENFNTYNIQLLNNNDDVIVKKYDLVGDEVDDDTYAYKIEYCYEDEMIISVYDGDEIYWSLPYSKYKEFYALKQKYEIINEEDAVDEEDIEKYEIIHKHINGQYYFYIKDKQTNEELEYLANTDKQLRKKQIVENLINSFKNCGLGFTDWITTYGEYVTSLETNKYEIHFGKNLQPKIDGIYVATIDFIDSIEEEYVYTFSCKHIEDLDHEIPYYEAFTIPKQEESDDEDIEEPIEENEELNET